MTASEAIVGMAVLILWLALTVIVARASWAVIARG